MNVSSVVGNYTAAGAWCEGLDKIKGTLEVGKLADFVVLSGDIMEAEDVRRLKVEMTVVGGRVVYRE